MREERGSLSMAAHVFLQLSCLPDITILTIQGYSGCLELSYRDASGKILD